MSVAAAFPSLAGTLEVGPGKRFSTPSEAARVAADGDTVLIAAGRYPGDIAEWRQNNLTIRGVGGMAIMDVTGLGNGTSDIRGIWTVRGDNVWVENVAFTGMRNRRKNGAGIFHQGNKLRIAGSRFSGNDNGILTGRFPLSDILIERSIFTGNGHGDGFSHNIYVGRARSLTVRFSYLANARRGHNLKSRAATNRVLYNRITDERGVPSSYLVDLPDGGNAEIVGNVFHQAPATTNRAAVSYAAELKNDRRGQVVIAYNTFVNRHDDGVFIQSHSALTPLDVFKNIFVGPGAIAEGLVRLGPNLQGRDPAFRAPAGIDYRLRSGSPAIRRHDPDRRPYRANVTPKFEYVHPAFGRARADDKAPDFGAYEYVPDRPEN